MPDPSTTRGARWWRALLPTKGVVVASAPRVERRPPAPRRTVEADPIESFPEPDPMRPSLDLSECEVYPDPLNAALAEHETALNEIDRLRALVNEPGTVNFEALARKLVSDCDYADLSGIHLCLDGWVLLTPAEAEWVRDVHRVAKDLRNQATTSGEAGP